MNSIESVPKKSTVDFFTDNFNDDHHPGSVIGGHTPNGVMRRGIDLERRISIDNGALRIQPMIHPGWGRSALAYGPMKASSGVLFYTVLLNGHNTSDAGPLGQSFLRRIGRWAKGSNTHSLPQRAMRFIRKGDKRQFAHQVQRWYRLNQLFGNDYENKIQENLAVGWFVGDKEPGKPEDGVAFRMHATGPQNGELWVQIEGHYVPVLKSVQNIPLILMILQHGEMATYYAATIPGGKDLPVFPDMAPLGSTKLPGAKQMYAGIHQSTLGQIGFRVDTRVYQNQITELPEYSAWYGAAYFADKFTGNGELEDFSPATGEGWEVLLGKFNRSEGGLEFLEKWNRAFVSPQDTMGLFRLLLRSTSNNGVLEFQFRMQDIENFWSLVLKDGEIFLSIYQSGASREIVRTALKFESNDDLHEIQILDRGEEMQFTLNGSPIFEEFIRDIRFNDANQFGFAGTGPTCYLPISLEAHPRTIQFSLENQFSMDWLPDGQESILHDPLVEPHGDLDGRYVPGREIHWRKVWGSGRIEVLPAGYAKVDARPLQPNPGRTVYTLPWQESQFADLEVQITPPGSERGQWESGRSGLAFWENEERYLLVNLWLDDHYDGASISSFFNLNGFEELYDAVWTNIGTRVYWGKPFVLRAVFDGLRYKVYVDNELVLYRSLKDVYPNAEPIVISRIGILANWEWGEDTGSMFKAFTARH